MWRVGPSDVIIALTLIGFVLWVLVSSLSFKQAEETEVEEGEEEVKDIKSYEPHVRKEFPYTFKDFIGQENVIKQLRMKTSLHNEYGRILRHTLLYGGPGLGKTTLSELVAQEIKAPFISIEGVTLDSKDTLLKLAYSIKEGTVLFIDELHQINRLISEILFKVMENFIIDYEEGGKFVNYEIPKFTIIGATTDPGLILKPMRDRFVNQYILSPYNDNEMYNIAKRLGSSISNEGIVLLSQISQRTPRILKSYLSTLEDMQIYFKYSEITTKVIREFMKMNEISETGLTKYQLDTLELLGEIGRPVGIKAIANAVGVPIRDMENMVEPYLVQERLITLTPRGRAINEKGLEIIRR